GAAPCKSHQAASTPPTHIQTASGDAGRESAPEEAASRSDRPTATPAPEALRTSPGDASSRESEASQSSSARERAPARGAARVAGALRQPAKWRRQSLA